MDFEVYFVVGLLRWLVLLSLRGVISVVSGFG